MPRNNIDYTKTVMYKIVCNDVTILDCYNGHTTDYTERKYSHKARCTNPTNKKYHLKVYVKMREHGGWDNWSMIEIEKYPCADVNEATARERYWYEELQSKLNTNCPHRSNAEYVKEHAEKYRITASKYYHEHKAVVLEKQKQYRQNNLELVHKQQAITSAVYRENNREKINVSSSKYYESHKQKISDKAKEIYTCSCGTICRHGSKSIHFKTKKHCEFIASQTNIIIDV